MMTNEEIAAFALAVHVRNCALEAGVSAAQMGDNFPVVEWQTLYSVALEKADDLKDSYPDPEMCVHEIQPHLTAAYGV